jgi:hypothetical protein
MKDYIGIFPEAASREYCEQVIKWFEYNKKEGSAGKKIINRQELEQVKSVEKDSELFFFENPEVLTVETNSAILQGFGKIIWNCYQAYRKKYGILDSLDLHKISPSVKIQKYEPGQGYHVWHCDANNILSSRRIVSGLLYLNTVENGGETEFLYQSLRVAPVQGTFLLSPAGWTHPHRGNPPLTGTKYIMNTWLELME